MRLKNFVCLIDYLFVCFCLCVLLGFLYLLGGEREGRSYIENNTHPFPYQSLYEPATLILIILYQPMKKLFAFAYVSM